MSRRVLVSVIALSLATGSCSIVFAGLKLFGFGSKPKSEQCATIPDASECEPRCTAKKPCCRPSCRYHPQDEEDDENKFGSPRPDEDDENFGSARPEDEEGEPQFGAPESGVFAAPPATGEVSGESGSFGIRGPSITIPEIRLELPTISMPSLYRTRRSAEMRVDGGKAPYVASGPAALYGQMQPGGNVMLRQPPPSEKPFGSPKKPDPKFGTPPKKPDPKFGSPPKKRCTPKQDCVPAPLSEEEEEEEYENGEGYYVPPPLPGAEDEDEAYEAELEDARRELSEYRRELQLLREQLEEKLATATAREELDKERRLGQLREELEEEEEPEQEDLEEAVEPEMEEAPPVTRRGVRRTVPVRRNYEQVSDEVNQERAPSRVRQEQVVSSSRQPTRPSTLARKRPVEGRQKVTRSGYQEPTWSQTESESSTRSTRRRVVEESENEIEAEEPARVRMRSPSRTTRRIAERE